ncbi:MAG TPA: metal-dependent transcriptional regulator [Gaiellales bacterium]|jgi:DtxR family Mn-dependent transcriptional regulator|nr:metal-dependent transcriptional regulator [Gaiellales bacterium]
MASENTHARHTSNSEAIEDYLKAVYTLARRTDRSVSTGELAERLGVTPATATSMLKRLDRLGLVSHQPYYGVSLMPAGEQVAVEVIRHHRLVESYLSEALGMPWDRVHEEAEVLEHYISEELEGLIAAKLGDPSHDPHGDPIPGPDLVFPYDDSRPLEAMEDGETAVFTRVSDSDPQMLRYLADRGIRPGARLRLVRHQPFGGPVFVEVEGTEHALGGELVHRMRVSTPNAGAARG